MYGTQLFTIIILTNVNTQYINIFGLWLTSSLGGKSSKPVWARYWNPYQELNISQWMFLLRQIIENQNHLNNQVSTTWTNLHW